MKYLNTKHEKNAAKITTLVALIIILLIFVVGPKYMDPPEEYGVAVNFGTTDFGSGNVQPTKPIKSQDLNINKPAETEPTEAVEPTKATEATEEVLTQETEEAVAIQKQKEAEAKAKAIADAKAKAEADRIAKEKKEQEEKKKKLDALIGGVSNSEGSESGSEGDDDKAGDKGQLNGDPYAPSYFGEPGSGSGGVGYGLNGRGTPSKQVYKQDCNESGMVIVKIVVNRNGNVVEAIPGVKGTTNTASCLLEPAKKIALSHKWRADNKAPAKQVGFVKVNFNLGQ
ncbi:energy transducer TonB [Lacinutrix sp. C3R15]|uniref:energy transducer TonB n=1 Tax=Flavobacteriaceae TaxID=49546 RepID=UPI001C098D53|nr:MULTISPECIES: energy transducer TonB [Flavobacteriaceae]MBU2938441.1 energy transducer TonB [Lacinutrix sp. C3R15]MDO6621755.1 energy transducer TonB [Oceanihabitans sp. 1_MG-2023]